MIVKDLMSGNRLESNDELVVEAWMDMPTRFIPADEQEAEDAPENEQEAEAFTPFAPSKRGRPAVTHED